VFITDADGDTSVNDPAVLPTNDKDGLLGSGDGTNSTKAWQEVHTDNLFQYTPEPASEWCKRNDKDCVADLDELKRSTWDDPPEYPSQSYHPEDEDRPTVSKLPEDEDGKRGVENSHMLNYLLETCKSLAGEKDRLEERIERLEDQV